MSRFRGRGVKKKKGEKKPVEFIIPDFLPKNSISIIYAPPKQGKSMFMCGVAKWIYNNTNLFVEYFDNDNPLMALEARDVDELWEELEDRFDYIHPEELEKSAEAFDNIIDVKDALDALVKDADVINKNYDDTVFIFDSATDFCDESNDSSVKSFMKKMKRLRLAGGTIVILHHTNKKDPDYKGSSVFRSATDSIYKLTLEYENSEGKFYKLEKDDARLLLKDCAFKLEDQYVLEILDWDEFCIPMTDQLDIKKIVMALKNNKTSMKQGELLAKALDTTSTNKTATRLLEKYDGKYWQSKKEGRVTNYTLL